LNLVLLSCADRSKIEVVYHGNSFLLTQSLEKFTSAAAVRDLVVEINSPSNHGPVIHLLSAAHHQPDAFNEMLTENISTINDDGYKLIKKEKSIYILAKTDRGCAYGLQDLTEQLDTSFDLSQVKERAVNPALSFRAIKFNLPWSPYRPGITATQHLATCRDLTLWEAFLDMMVDNRFNALTLWNQHPFPYLIKSKNYPLANDFNDREMSEWRSFWKSLFKMAKDRAIETYLVNWNIVVSEEFAEAYGAKVHDDRSDLVKTYTRESITQVINEYEDLTGLGVTLADWMGNWGDDLMTSTQREDWIQETFVEGMKNADRKIKFIHRAVLAGDPQEMRQVIDQADLPDKTIVEVKFNWSHGHSTPNLSLTHSNNDGTIMRGFWDPKPENYFIAWMIRNEDFFVLRWGDPQFIRDHIATNHLEYVDGYFVGSEGYIPALDYSHIDPHPHKTWNYAFEKQWLFYHLWGRLMYNPKESDQLLAQAFEKRYSGVDGMKILEAFSLASRVPLYLATFYKSTWDFTLYSEGFLSPRAIGFDDQKSPFISIEELMKHEVLDRQYLSIDEYGQALREGKTINAERITPLQLADKMEMECQESIDALVKLRAGNPEPTLQSELDDIETWCHLGYYFADKLRAGVHLQDYLHTKEKQHKLTAITQLEKCITHWENVIRLTKDRYKPMPYVSIESDNPRWGDFSKFHWSQFKSAVAADVEYARNLK
jgi:hypothetical protein